VSRHPNIVLIMADDLGYGDLRCYNSRARTQTPNLDRLATEGMRFTDAHAPAAVCVPTRYGLLTGRYPFRMSPRPRGTPLLEPGRPTLASLLSQRGYHTACIGKWHLGMGDAPPDYAAPMRGGPVDRGFDHFFGIPASLDIPPYYYILNDRAVAPPSQTIAANNSPDYTPIQGAFWRAGGIAPDFKHEDVLPRLTHQAIDYLKSRDAASNEKPFFLYLALTAPHTPWLPTSEFQGKTEVGSYGDFVLQVDDSVGRVLKAIDALQLRDDTLVIFTSDNGPVWYPEDEKRFSHRATGPLRGMKGDAWEGGHRMPLLARWPERIEAASTQQGMICHTDLMATVAELTEQKLPENAGEDSVSFLPVLLGSDATGPLRRTLVSQSSRNVLAIRQGPWKLIPALGSGGFTKPPVVKPSPDGPAGQLYNLETDLAETENLWTREPEMVQRLTQLLKRYQSDGRGTPAP
jgi:arylsulfatase A-like enzyme